MYPSCASAPKLSNIVSSSSVPSGRASPRPTHLACGGTSGIGQIQFFLFLASREQAPAARRPTRGGLRDASLPPATTSSAAHLRPARPLATRPSAQRQPARRTQPQRAHRSQSQAAPPRASTPAQRPKPQRQAPRTQRLTTRSQRRTMRDHTAPGRHERDTASTERTRAKRLEERRCACTEKRTLRWCAGREMWMALRGADSSPHGLGCLRQKRVAVGRQKGEGWETLGGARSTGYTSSTQHAHTARLPYGRTGVDAVA